ncbi:ABC-type multidrug transport system, permease component [hydrothermal vent metagenome]|uniref:ABC-type multidrug transport system, permease component n=1 Tax=hydrothermal vent metagenome TaxID=652676 RepID=A0A1W1CGI9_9ZZZZ
MRFVETLKAEAKSILADRAIILTIIGGVILYAFLYPQPYAKQSVSRLKITVVDQDQSSISRDIIFKLNATPQITVARHDASMLDAQKALEQGAVKAILLIPKEFQRDLLLKRSPTIALGADSSYFLIYGGVLEGAMKSILTQSAGIKIATLLKEQTPINHAKDAYAPYSLKTLNLFNQENSYIQYVVPAVFVLILQQTLLIGLGIFGGGLNERRREGEEGYFTQAPIWHMILSRFLLFGSLFLLHLLFYFGFSFELFGVTRVASISDLLLFGVGFLSASIALGIFIGSLLNSREIATPMILFSSLPLVFSAGFVWPIESLPTVVHTLSLLVPSTPAIEGFLQLNQMGASFAMVRENYLILWLQTASYLLLSYGVMRRRLR